ncbi:MAG: hypothetical protein IJX76_01820 [Clostridia bacterium]|nr:hypothetical protein [Clostridia bacterium]
MICNASMYRLLCDYPAISTPMMAAYRICKRRNVAGAPYWRVADFCGMDAAAVLSADADLTALEWDGNEVMLDMADSIPVLLNAGLLLLYQWKEQMTRDFPETPFDILVSVDEGKDGVSPSVTLRFYAVRGGMHYVEPTQEAMDGFAQPVLIQQVNQ